MHVGHFATFTVDTAVPYIPEGTRIRGPLFAEANGSAKKEKMRMGLSVHWVVVSKCLELTSL